MGWKTLMLLLVVILAGVSSSYAYNWQWKSGAKVSYHDSSWHHTFVSDSGTINVGDTITRDYIINNASGLTPGGAHLEMTCYTQGGLTIIKATVSTDNCNTDTTLAYIFSGDLKVDEDDSMMFSLFEGESDTKYLIIGHGWVDSLPTQTPIPPLATILVLMTIPAIVLRKITK